MGLIYMILFVIGLAGTVGWLAYQHAEAERRARLWIWRVAAVGAGLNVHEETPGNLVISPTMTGRAGPLQVRLERYRPSKGKTGTRIVVAGFKQGQLGLELRRQGLLDGLRSDEVTIGAPHFDDEVYVEGDAAKALAVFDAETRWKVVDLLRGSVTAGEKKVPVKAAFRDETLEVLFDESPYPGEDRIAEAFRGVLTAVLDVARRLVVPSSPLRRIAANLASEPEPGVRLASVRQLAREVYHSPELWDPLAAACGDPVGEVRLEAAMALGPQGHKTLRALVADEETGDALAARAVAALGVELTAGQTATELRRALARSRGATARACLEALASWGNPKSEGLLIDAHASADPEVAAAAARALGQVGTAVAVTALRDATPAWPGELRSAARQAIADIQARLTGAAAGQLSLAGREAGALSLAEDSEGRLSLAGGKPTEGEPMEASLEEGEETPPGRPRAGRERA
jgi:hypothetical protein